MPSSAAAQNFTQTVQTLATGYSPQQMQDCQDAQTTQQYVRALYVFQAA